jgi:hypothetical protein
MVNRDIKSDCADRGDRDRAGANWDVKEHDDTIVVADSHARLHAAFIRIRETERREQNRVVNRALQMGVILPETLAFRSQKRKVYLGVLTASSKKCVVCTRHRQ